MNKIMKTKEFLCGKPNLEDQNINRLLVRLSIPAIIAIFINNLYNMIDSIFIGQFVGADALGALTIAYPFMNIIFTIGMTISTGGMSVISRSLGEKNMEKAKMSFGNSITLMLVIAVLLSGFGLIFLEPTLRFAGGQGELLKLGKDYMEIILVGSIFMAPAYIFGELLRAEGKSRESMMILAVGSISNIILDFLFIAVFSWGVKGAALATAIAYFISFCYGIVMIIKCGSILELKIKYFKLNFSLVKEMLSVGISSFISHSAGSIATIFANKVMSSVGGVQLLNAIGLFGRIQSLVFMPTSGITQGMQPILGFNYGAKRLENVKKAAKLALRYVFGIVLINSILVLIFTNQIATLFVNDTELVAYAVPYIRLAIVFAAIGAWQWVGGTVFRAVGMAKKAYFFSLLRMILIFTPAMIILGNLIGPIGCWLSYALADLLSGVISRKYILSFLKKLKFEENETEKAITNIVC